MDDTELARRSILGFGEMVAALGGDGAIRRPDAVGANVGAASANHWLDAAVVPLDAAPPADEPSLPHSLWTVAAAAPGRVEEPGIAMPCLGLELSGLGPAPAAAVEAPPLPVVGAVNDRAYDQGPQLEPLIGALRDDRVRTYGLRAGGEPACVLLTLALGDDVSVQYVATEPGYRRRGLATTLMLAALAAERDRGMRTATLQASPDGLPVYERIGFRRVATLRAFLRPDAV
jgi:ribosomal protein S18 acetylase RimI-like enzyme